MTFRSFQRGAAFKALISASTILGSLFVLPQAANATYTTTVNVTDFCTTVNGSTDNTSCIQSAVNSRASTGGIVFFPCGQYRVSGTVTLPAGGISLQGSGRCTQWNGYGNFDDIRVNVGGTGDFYDNSVEGIYFAEYNKTGGTTLYLNHVSSFTVDDVIIDAPPCGITVKDFNNLAITRSQINNVSTPNCQAIYLTAGGAGDPSGRADVANLEEIVVSSSAYTTGNKHGILVDGAVFTVNARNLHLVNVDGHAMWFRNNVGAWHAPEFASVFNLETDSPYSTGIWIQAGDAFHFSDVQMAGSKTNSNIYLEPGVSRVSFTGGFSSGANQAGIHSYATQVSIADMDITNNSNVDAGGTAGAWPGILLEAQSRMVTISGNKIGTPGRPTAQSWGIQVNASADQYAITGNVVRNNANAISAASGTTSKVVANNAQ